MYSPVLSKLLQKMRLENFSKLAAFTFQFINLILKHVILTTKASESKGLVKFNKNEVFAYEMFGFQL